MKTISITLAAIAAGLAVVVSAMGADDPATSDNPVAVGRALLAQGDWEKARQAYTTLIGRTNLPPAHRAMLQLHLAEACRGGRDLAAALAAYASVAAMTDAPTHLRQEAEQGMQALESDGAGKRARVAAGARSEFPPLAKPGMTLHVAPDGSDANDGSRRHPFASVERARDEIREVKQRGGLPAGGVQVAVHGGTYRVTSTFALDARDSGTEAAPIVYRCAGKPAVFSGGMRLKGFNSVNDAGVLARLPEVARGKVVQTDLTANGVTNVWPLILGGFSSGRGFKSHPVMELFFDGQSLPLAHGPEDGFVRIAGVTDADPVQIHGLKGSKLGRFTYAGDLPARWQDEAELWLYGYWFWGWADSYERVTAIDPAKREVTLAPPYHGYGYRTGQPFYAVNALSELDRPGEWYLDRARHAIYLWPPSNPDRAVVELSVADFPFVELKDVSHVTLAGLTWELGCVDGVLVRGGKECRLAGCTIRRFAGNGVEISDGSGHGLLSCDIHTLGRGGVVVSGGDRKTLTPGGHVVENCHIHDLSRIDHTYTPAVLCSGVGQRIAHNWLHHVPSSALRVGGNDHVIELNEINHVVLESDDQGGVDMWGDPTLLGNVYRHNYFHHIGNWREPEKAPDCGQAGIRLDDAISGVLIYGNVFFRCGAGKLGFGGVQIHGGKDNIIDGNLFADCRWAVSFSPWGSARWKEFIRGPRQSPAINPALYAVRYPAFAQLDNEPDRNWLWRNTVFDCGAFLHRNGGGARGFDNLVTTNNPGFADAARGDFSLKKSARQVKQADLTRIPFAEIGLYRDAWRRGVPIREIQALRRER